MITKEQLLKKLERFSLDIELELVKVDDCLCLIIKESGEVISFERVNEDFKCPNNSMICGQPYACDACPYNEEVKNES